MDNITLPRAELQAALDALENVKWADEHEETSEVIETLRARLAQPSADTDTEIAQLSALVQVLDTKLAQQEEKPAPWTMDSAGRITQTPKQEEKPHKLSEYIDQRVRSWRLRIMNDDGDLLELADFMAQDAFDDFIDYVCDEQALSARLAQPQENPEPCQHYFVRDNDAPLHHCCQKCGVVKKDREEKTEPVVCKDCGEVNPAEIHTCSPQREEKPVAVVSGYYGGQCVITPMNPSRVFNAGTALYDSPVQQQEKPEPVVWAHWDSPSWSEEPVTLTVITKQPTKLQKESANWFPLYPAPPKREWRGLTDEEIRNEANHHVFDESFFNGAVWARGKIKEKNNG